MDTKKSQVILVPCTRDGVAGWISPAELFALVARPSGPVESTKPDGIKNPPVVTPPVTEPVQPPKLPLLAGMPRDFIGHLDGHPFYLATFGAERVPLQVLDEATDTIVPRGFEVNYEPLPGLARISGKATGNWGYNPPAGFTAPDGYVTLEFPAENGGGKYYKRSSLSFQHYAVR